MIRRHRMLPGAQDVVQVACAMRETVAMLDGSADMLEALAGMASADVAGDIYRHAETIRAIRRQVAGPPRDQWEVERSGSLAYQGEAGSAD